MDDTQQSEEARQTAARKAVKHGMDSSDIRRKREEYTVSIRKSKREEFMNKRRNISGAISRMEQAEKAAQFQAATANGVAPPADIVFGVRLLSCFEG